MNGIDMEPTAKGLQEPVWRIAASLQPTMSEPEHDAEVWH